MKFALPEGVGRTLARQALLFDKHSPTIFFAAGIVGTVASTALACRATLQIDSVLVKAQEDLRIANEVHIAAPEEYPEDELANIQKHIRIRTFFEIGQLYAPAVGLGLLSVASLTHSNNLLSRRNAALSAAYVAVDKAFREYRERVVEHYGEDKDRELRYGVERVSIVDPETGRKKNVHRAPINTPSMYARWFQEGNANWKPQPEYNLMFLRSQQEYANLLLHSRGHVLLNDVYDMLGLPRSEPGCLVGWVSGVNGRDDFIDFGLWNAENMDEGSMIDFVKGVDGAVLLDFNVDGPVHHLIGNGETSPWHAG